MKDWWKFFFYYFGEGRSDGEGEGGRCCEGCRWKAENKKCSQRDAKLRIFSAQKYSWNLLDIKKILRSTLSQTLSEGFHKTFEIFWFDLQCALPAVVPFWWIHTYIFFVLLKALIKLPIFAVFACSRLNCQFISFFLFNSFTLLQTATLCTVSLLLISNLTRAL